jgi:hypothetical protein
MTTRRLKKETSLEMNHHLLESTTAPAQDDEFQATISELIAPQQLYQEPPRTQHWRQNLKIAVVDADSAALLQQQHHARAARKSPSEFNSGSSSGQSNSFPGGFLSPDHFNGSNAGGMRSEPSLSSSSASPAAPSSSRTSISSSGDDDDHSVLLLFASKNGLSSTATSAGPDGATTPPRPFPPPAPMTFREDLNEAEQRFRVALDKSRTRSALIEKASFDIALTSARHGRRFLKMLTVEAHAQNPKKITAKMMIALHEWVDHYMPPLYTGMPVPAEFDDDPLERFDNDVAISSYQSAATLIAAQKLFAPPNNNVNGGLRFPYISSSQGADQINTD